ncbi:Stk1 family PASTA domain-containing Ser/Thr kinase [Streptomyces sp. RFCAC02]|uniref:Stk1 family PASTA domain-containing Ser/Thr kinase n=1 Tax=Streptomyces sp. RFCAC02 TaxID=2499143 RepID=UPI00101E9157|nr:Stk1 family PASTA domain-containing Ser/Thr kinase [Streptomyces sp. RFCAC02]
MDTTLHDPLIGHVLDGRYRVDERIAAGGMATVYRAFDTRLDRVLALKVMHPALAGDAAFVERFIREAKAVARLDHPNVVGVLDQGTDATHVYLAMEYVAGCTLRDVLRERRALAPRAVLDILEPLLAGLAAAHRAGLVHRDVKPENVLIGADGRVKVADFGLVRGVDTHTSATTDSLLGTVSYLAPEQIEGGAVDARTDVYACGVLLHEALTGAKPHTGDSPARVLYAHVHEDVPPPSRLVPGLAPALDGLVATAAARDPLARPEDAAALLSLVRAARAVLTDAELDAVPPAHRAPAPGDDEETRELAGTGPEDETRVVPRVLLAAPADPDDRTAVIDPADLAVPPPPGRWRRLPRRGRISLIVAALLLVCGGLGVWYVNSGQFLRTPGVYGLTQEEAVETLEDAGLRVEVEQGWSDTVDEGHVVSTDPERGERVRRNTTVHITVSRGPEVTAVPDLVGVPLDEARRLLDEAGLTEGEVDWEFSSEVERNAVIAADPEPGTERRPDSPVDLVVSKGRAVDVPRVIGMDQDEATRELTEAGFEVEIDPVRVWSDEDEGDVAGQSPGSSERASEGDTVTLTLSKGPELVEVPDVRGEDVDDAKEILEDAGFRVNVNQVFLTGTVFNQSVYDDTAPRGSTITIWVR